MTSFLLRLTMLSDWHVGTGTGRHGFADRLVKRDAHGLPFVPAKTMTGVWRDACEVAAHALDGGPTGPWHAWTEHLFGSQPALSEAGTTPVGEGRPREAMLSLRSLHYPREVTAVLVAKPRLAAAVTFLKPGVKIALATGRAEDRLLRFDEMARAGAVLTGTAEIAGYADLEENQKRCTTALLAAGARLLEGIGGKRRRGTGRCRLDLDGIAADLDWLAAVDVPPRPPPWNLPSATGRWALPAPQRAPTTWEIAELRIELRTPVIVHERTVGNAVRSMDYVHGSVLLPAVLQRLSAVGLAGQDAVATAARAGDLIVTNATVEVHGGPGRPVPRFVVRHKGSGSPGLLCNRATQSCPGWFHPELVDGGYLPSRVDDRPEILTVARTEQAHNTIDDGVQRPTEAVGGLYMYQAMKSGTLLRAEVRAPAGLLQPGWHARLDGDWRIGRSSKDDYGLAAVRTSARIWSPDPAPPASSGETRSLRVWLLSDLLLTDERLRPSSDPGDIARALGDALGALLAPAVRRPSGLVVASTGDRRTESWQRRWGLPRASLVGMSAGSCLTFDIEGQGPSPAAVRLVELTGIGLRRGEGFGQVRIDDPLLYAGFGSAQHEDPQHPADRPPATAAVSQPDWDASPSQGRPQAPALGADSLRAIEEAAWRQAIAERSESMAGTTVGRRKVLGDGFAKVPLSQLSALRMIASALGAQPNDRAAHWLRRLVASKGRERTWPTEVREQLAGLLTDPKRVWTLLALPETDLSSSPATVRDLRRQLWAEAVRVLVADCLSAQRRSGGEVRDA